MAMHKFSGWLGTTACLLAAALPSAPALAVTDADRLAVYKEFRVQYDSKQYAAAKPLAEKLVQLTEEQYGPEELVLATPLTNLATVNYKLGDFPAAIEHYQRSLRILQAKPPKTKLVGFMLGTMPEHEAPKECHLVIRDGQIAGRVTSIAYSPTLERHVGLAYVSPALAVEGGVFTVRADGGRMVQATVARTPFYDPAGERQKPPVEGAAA